MKVQSHCSTDIVQIYRYEVIFEREGQGEVRVSSPRVARLKVNPGATSGNLVRDVMFLDEFDILVVGTVEGSLCTYANSDDPSATGYVERIPYGDSEVFFDGDG